MNINLSIFFLTCGVLLLSCSSAGQPVAAGDASQPKLLIGPGGWPAYRQKVEQTARLAPLRNWLLNEADRLLKEPVMPYKVTGGRLLTTSRFVLLRTAVLAQAYHLTDNELYAQRAGEELLNAARYPDWNPSHLLDTAELCTAVSLGIDWLSDYLPDADERSLRKALLEKGLRAFPSDHWFWTKNNNWNQVCLAGMVFAALVLEEDEPALAQQTFDKARQHWGNGLKAYEPDGVSYEGPSYWSYGATYSALMFSALQTAHGEDPKQIIPNGLKQSARVRSLMNGPSGEWFNFADTGGTNRFEPALFYYAQALGQPELAATSWQMVDNLSRVLEASAADNPVRLWLAPFALVWATDPGNAAVSNTSLVWQGGGPCPIAVLRSVGGATPSQAYVAIKGGQGKLNHAHLDAGSFVAELQGVRWAIDLGSENYGQVEKAIGAKFWDMSQSSRRWSLVRYHNLQHNTLTFNSQAQNVNGKATVRASTVEGTPTARVELSAVYPGVASRVTRTISIADDQTILLTDLIEGLATDTEVTWTWMTDAVTNLQSPDTVSLVKLDKRSTLKLLQPADATFVLDTDFDDARQAFETRNPGVTAVRIKFSGNESLGISVRLSTTQ